MFRGREPLTFDEGGNGAVEQTIAEAIASVWWFPRHPMTVDVLPGCGGNPIPATGTGKVFQVVVYGDSVTDGDDLDLTSLNVRGALATHTSVEYVDGDGYLDVVAQFDAGDLNHRGVGAMVRLNARTQGDAAGRAVWGEDDVTWTSTTDGDADGVPTACDACPAAAATPPSVDGCP